LECLEDRAVPTTYKWIGGAHSDASHTSGDPNLWSNALNWLNTSTGTNGAGVPGASDIATFSDTVNFTLSNPTTSYTQPFNKLPVTGGSGTLSLNALVINSTWGSKITIRQPLSLSGASEWDSGIISIGTGSWLTNSGTLTLANPSTIVLTSTGGELDNHGTIIQTGVGDLVLTTGSGASFETTLGNESGATIDLRSDASIYSDSSGGGLTNEGTVRKSAGSASGASTIGGGVFYFDTDSVVDVQQGNLRISATGVDSIEGGAVPGGTNLFSVANGSVVDLAYGGATVGYQGTFTGSGAGQVRLSGGTLKVGAFPGNNVTFNFPAGLFHWNGGNTIDTNGNTLTNAGSTTIDGTVNVVGGGDLVNSGTLVAVSGGTLTVGGGCILANQAAGVLDLQANATLSGGSGGGTLTNSGKLLRSTGGSTVSSLRSGLAVVNNGIVDVEQGTFQIGADSVTSSSGTFTVASGATLVMAASAGNIAVSYSGTFTGSGAGTVSVGSFVLRLTGGTTFNFPAGLLHWNSSGYLDTNGNTLTNSGSLTIDGAATLGGNGELKNTGTITDTSASNNFFDITSSTAFATRLTNQGTLDLQSDAYIYSDSTAIFSNAGTLRKSAGSGARVSNIGGGLAFVTSNLIDVRQGILVISTNSVTGNAGNSFTVASGASLHLTSIGATVVYQGTFTGSGAGEVDLSDGTISTVKLGGPTTFNFPAGLMYWGDFGHLDTNGQTLTNAGSITIDSPTTLQGNGTLNNTGAIVAVSGGYLTFSSSAANATTLANQSGATFDLQGGAQVSGNGTFNNAGTLLRSAGGSATATLAGVAFINNNLINVQQDTLQLGASSVTGAVGNTVTVATGATLDLADTLLSSYQGTFTGSGGGTVRVGNGKLQLAADITFNFPAGLLHWNSSGTIDTNGHTLTNAGGLTIDGGANLSGNGTLTNAGAIVAAAGGSLALASSGAANATTLVNQSGSTFDLQANAAVVGGPGGGTFSNLGTLLRSAGGSAGSAIYAGIVVTNNNQISVQQGTLTIGATSVTAAAAGSTFTVAGGATLEMANGGTAYAGTFTGSGAGQALVDGALKLAGDTTFNFPPGLLHWNSSGTIDTQSRTLTNAGSISIDGTASLTGNYTQTASGALAIDLNGPAAGSQYDQLKATGNVSLAGALNLSIGIAPVVGTPFTIISDAGGAITGTFAGLPQGATITAGGATFQISYSAGSVVLTATAAAPAVTGVGENAGVAQRSMVTSVQVTFNTVVSIAQGAFALTYLGGGPGVAGSTVGGFAASTATVNGVTVATLSNFTGTDTSAGSLIDGRYSLTVTGSAVTANGMPMAGDFTFADSGTTTGNQLFRLYGDGDGNRMVNQGDLALFRVAFGSGDPTFDVDGNGAVNQTDLATFRTHFGAAV
jgi:hypothetical protein